MIVATAGHIDHGKTLLVKTLTGVDTDRLPEEKARGISIDLGFAYLPIATGGLIGFVDVPGHERFIRNMLAGVCGIDFALLIIAADDGIMPQTIEHLQILDLLHVAHGAAVITKIDRVDAGRVLEVETAVRALVATTRLAQIPVMAVSAVTGEGIQGLREQLIAEARRYSGKHTEGQHFRYAIDRAFTIAGSGTVVTGTVFNGLVKPGDRLTISPAGLAVRVRGIQIQGKAAPEARAGERCALNLTGADLDSVRRGDWVLAPEIHHPTSRIDARVKVLESEAHAVRHWTPVHLHLGTSDATARIATRRGAAVAPGESAIVQLVLDEPIGALRGDRFILRDQSASRTLGGGLVLDPFAPATRRSTSARIATLAAFEHDGSAEALAALIGGGTQAVDLGLFETIYNVTAQRATQLYDAARLVQLGKERRVGITHARLQGVRDAAIGHLQAFHKRQPQAAGESIETLRVTVAPDLAADAFASVMRQLADERKVELSSSTVRLPGHNATANAADDRLWQTIKPVLETSGFNAPQVRDLAALVKLKEPIVKDFLYRKARTGEVIRVAGDRFYPRATLAALASVAQATARSQANGLFTAAQYRDATGLGRSLAIEILECLDTLGITQRMGDARKMRKDYVPILGEPAAITKAVAPPRASPPVPPRKPMQHRR
jgi:selenocysteine-specific elongation factor